MSDEKDNIIIEDIIITSDYGKWWMETTHEPLSSDEFEEFKEMLARVNLTEFVTTSGNVVILDEKILYSIEIVVAQ